VLYQVKLLLVSPIMSVILVSHIYNFKKVTAKFDFFFIRLHATLSKAGLININYFATL